MKIQRALTDNPPAFILGHHHPRAPTLLLMFPSVPPNDAQTSSKFTNIALKSSRRWRREEHLRLGASPAEVFWLVEDVWLSELLSVHAACISSAGATVNWCAPACGSGRRCLPRASWGRTTQTQGAKQTHSLHVSLFHRISVIAGGGGYTIARRASVRSLYPHLATFCFGALLHRCEQRRHSLFFYRQMNKTKPTHCGRSGLQTYYKPHFSHSLLFLLCCALHNVSVYCF